MGFIDCIVKSKLADKSKIAELEQKLKSLVDNGTNPIEAERIVKNEYILSEQEVLNTELNTLKKSLGVKPSKLSPQPKANTTEIEKQYQEKLAELNVVEPEPVVEEDASKYVGITHAQTNEIANELGFPEYEAKPETVAEWDAKADQMIKDGYDIDKLLKSMDNGKMPDKIEQRIIAKYVATLKAKIEATQSDEDIKEMKRVVDISNVIGGREVGKSLAARKGLYPVDDSLAGYFMREMEEVGVDTLTDEQKAKITKEYNEIKVAQDAYLKKIEELQEENARLKAHEVVSGEVKKKSGRKTNADFASERKAIIEDIREKLKKARGEVNATPIPYAKELFAIAPDVAKLVKNLVEQGVVKAEDIISKIHEILSPDIPGITKKDVQDVIAGEYHKPKPTKNELAAKVRDLKDEIILLNKYQSLLDGEEPKTEKAKVERNQRIKELREKVKNHDLTKLAKEKSRIKSEIEKTEEQLKKGDFTPNKPPPIKLDAEGKELKKKLINLKQQRETRILKAQYDKRNKFQKGIDKVLEVFNIPRSVMASTDFSAPLNQAIVATTAYPKIAKAAAAQMFKSAFSQQEFDNWFYDLKDDPRYDLMKELKLGIADPHSPFLTAKEEAFMSGYAERIPIAGRFIKGSERAYVQYLNKMRVDLFNRFIDRFEEQGKSYDKYKKLYQATAKYVNNITGRGDLGGLEQYAPIFNTLLFSPRLMAARVNMLNPYYFGRLPRELKIAYLKDMGTMLSLGSIILGTMALYGATQDDEDKNKIRVETDPRSSDFAKIRQGETRWNVWGGFQPYVRLMGQVTTGERKSSNTGSIQELDGEGAFGTTRFDVMGSFLRGKLSPVPAMLIDFTSGRTATGEKVTLKDEALSHLIPLSIQGTVEAWKQYGPKALLNVGLPSIFGVGTQTYEQKKKEVKSKVEYKGREIPLTKEQKDFFQEKYNEKEEKYVKKVKSLQEYKDLADDADAKLALEQQAKRKAMKDSEDEMVKKYRSELQSQEGKSLDDKQKDKLKKKVDKALN